MNKNHFFLSSVITCVLSLSLLEAYPGDHTSGDSDFRTNPALKRTKAQSKLDTPKASKFPRLQASSKLVNTPQAAALRETNQAYTLTPNSWKSGQREIFGELAGTVRGLTPRSLSQKRKEAERFGIHITADRMLQITHHSPQAGDLAARTAQEDTTTLQTDAHSPHAGDLATSFRGMNLQPDSMYAPLTPLNPAHEERLHQQFAAFQSPTVTPMNPNALGASPLPAQAQANLQSPDSIMRRKLKSKANLSAHAASPLRLSEATSQRTPKEHRRIKAQKKTRPSFESLL